MPDLRLSSGRKADPNSLYDLNLLLRQTEEKCYSVRRTGTHTRLLDGRCWVCGVKPRHFPGYEGE